MTDSREWPRQPYRVTPRGTVERAPEPVTTTKGFVSVEMASEPDGERGSATARS